MLLEEKKQCKRKNKTVLQRNEQIFKLFLKSIYEAQSI